MNKFIFPIMIFLFACSTQKAEESQQWPNEFGYVGFADKVDRTMGTATNNCGFIDRVNIRSNMPLEKKITRAQQCVSSFIKMGKPFKFGTFRTATTSYLYEVIFLTPDQWFWIVVFDRSMDGSENMHIIQRCKTISEIDINTATYEGKHCVDVSTDEWLKDIKATK